MPEITQENFADYFFPTEGQHKPVKGEVLARYAACAEFINGPDNMKQNVIDLLKMEDKVKPAIQVLRRIGHFAEKDAVRILREMAEDMLVLTEQQVLEKPYKGVIEQFYWTKEEYVPTDDPHWQLINMLNLDSFLEKTQ